MRGELCRLILGLTVLAPVARAQSAADGPILAARAVPPTVQIKMWSTAGHLRLVAWDRDSVVVRGRVAASERFFFSLDGGALKLGVEARPGAGTTGRSDLVIHVPRRSGVSVKTVSAEIVADGVTGWFYSVSGSIRLSGRASSIDAESMTGSLDLDVTTPWIHARTGDGHLLLRGEPQDADASTIGGTLSIATRTLVRGQFASVSGDIRYVGTPAAASIFEFTNHSGGVDLLLPPNASASLTLSSITGPIENGFTPVRPIASTPRSMRLSLGRGEAQVAVRTFRGTIRIHPR